MKKTEPSQPPVAIIGIGCIFAKSPDLKGYLRLLMGGVDGIDDPPASHKQLYDCFDPDPSKADHIYCNRGGFLPAVDFDPVEFGIPPHNLEATDTSQLLSLVVAKQALADAGYGKEGKSFNRSKCSVILGVTGTQELVIPLGARLGHPIWRRALSQAGVGVDQTEEVIKKISGSMVEWQENSFPGLLGNVVAGRIANRFDLGGTNCVVDAACASSIGAIRMAVMELAGGQCDMAITGGVDTINDAFMHMCFAKTHILSSSGDVRPFSADADGTVLGEGIGLMVLKRLDDAERDQDRIYAVIKGIGSSSDGKSQSIYAPRPEGQAKALRRAYAVAATDPGAVELVEAHGTGTRVGDLVEFNALCDVFGPSEADSLPCALGSVKSNIGHTKAAAGTAGLIKGALSLYHKVLPPTLKAERHDPKLALQQSRFYLNTRLRPWIKGNGKKRYAGVSAFGFGGSNFHTVLEEYSPRKTVTSWSGQVEIVAFSGPDDNFLENQLKEWNIFLKSNHRINDRTARAAKTRRLFNHQDARRMVVVFDQWDELERIITRSLAVEGCLAAWKAGQPEKSMPDYCFLGADCPSGLIACLFPGQGSQYPDMGRDIICCFPESFGLFQDAEQNFQGARPLGNYVYPLSFHQNTTEKENALKATQIAQPALGAVSAAMFAALKRFGLQPSATCGHSYGELVALHAAGWISSDDLWRLSVTRGRLMAQAAQDMNESGSMLAVKAPLDDLRAMVTGLDPRVVLANLNGPNQGVLSGSRKAILTASEQCRKRGWPAIELPVAGAFHSPLVSAAQIPFQELVETIQFTPSEITVMSNTSGVAYPSTKQDAVHLLGRQLANPVDFVANIQNLYNQGIRTFVEVGPKAILTSLVKTILSDPSIQAISMDGSSGRNHGLYDLARTIGVLAALGYDIHLDKWETPVPEKSKAHMTVKISGANYRRPEKSPPALPKQTRVQEDMPGDHDGPVRPTNFKTVGDPMQFKSSSHSPIGDSTAADMSGQILKMGVSLSDPNQTDTQKMNDLHAALAAIQQGLTSVTALQSQTAQAHQKFLDAQTQAGITLRQIMQQVHAFTGAVMGTPILQAPVLEPITPVLPNLPPIVPASPEKAQLRQIAGHSAPTPKIDTGPTPELRAKSDAQSPLPGVHANSGAADVRQVLVGIVSELTGYPEEMLGLDMDIESDLGIDSIKRVEILSALEEKRPALPKVTPDMMGSLKTLGQICDYLAGSDKPVSGLVGNPQTPTPLQDTIASSGQDSDPADVRQVLVGIVSELTGYPEEMLGLDMDIESDLGIDSIKRVEILSALEEKRPALPKVTPDMMGSLKTLGQICTYLSGVRETTPLQLSSAPEYPVTATGQSEIPRRIVRILPKPKPAGPARVTVAPSIGIVCRHTGLLQALNEELQNKGFEPKTMSGPEDIESSTGLSGVLLCAPLSPTEVFQWGQVCGNALRRRGTNHPAFLVTLTFLDGAFGFKGESLGDPYQGALPGFIKTAAQEWPTVRCTAIDIDPAWQNFEEIARAVVKELADPDPDQPTEIGLSGPDERVVLELAATPVPTGGRFNLGEQDVAVISGGARGVTAEAAIALGRKTGCRLALLGRTPGPQPEPDWLHHLQEEAQIKLAIRDHHFETKSVSPKEIESVYRLWMAGRQIRNTLTRLAEHGLQARYYSVDVCNPVEVGSCLQTVRKELGPIKALIHGAGVLEDRLIVDKQLLHFQNVFNTKVKGLESLVAATANDDLRYLVCFSSIVARVGNSGQSDYAMANEVLNKMARQYQLTHPDRKVVSLNWGPWDGGMVTPVLKRNFIKNQVALIPVEQGAQATLDEMVACDGRQVEIILGGPLASLRRESTRRPVNQQEHLALAARREIDVDNYPILRSHLLNGKPVVPLALITEWLAHSALHANPGLSLIGIDNLRLLKGIRLDGQKKSVRLMAGKPRRMGDHFEVDVEIRNGSIDGHDVIHSSAKAILSERLMSPPDFKENGHFTGHAMAISVKEAYDLILFHGHDLRGIQNIIGISDRGMAARIATAPSPDAWVRNPLRSRWICDPLVLDCAFQMGILWSYQQFQKVSLPSFATAYRQFCRKFPEAGVIAILEVTQTSDHKIVGDFIFLDNEKHVVACLDGYEAVMDRDLIHKFHPN